MNKEKTKLKAKFCEFQNGLAMQVEYLDERFSHVNNKMFTYDHQKVEVSNRVSSLMIGYKSDDWHLILCLGSEDVCSGKNHISDKYFEFITIIEALKDWAKNWEGWKDEPAIEPVITRYEGGVTYVEV